MAAIDQYAVSINATFRQRIEMLILKAAAAVQAEPTNTDNHGQRSMLAQRIFHDPAGYAVRFAAAVAADPNNAGISLESSDPDLLFTVNSLFNAFTVTVPN